MYTESPPMNRPESCSEPVRADFTDEDAEITRGFAALHKLIGGLVPGENVVMNPNFTE